MKNYKKLFCLFLSIVMVLGVFAGCRKDKPDETVAPTEAVATVAPTEAPTEAATEPATEPETEPAAEPTEIVEYLITYKLYGGKMPGGVKLTYTENDPIVLPIPTKDKHDFKGWYENEDFTGEPVETTTGTTGDKIYYAKWELIVTSTGTQGGTGSTHAHRYTADKKVAPTCFVDGYTVYKCACGDTFKDDFVSGAHEWEKWIVVKEPTVEEDGLMKRSCKLCKYVESSVTAKLPAPTEPGETAPTVPEATKPEQNEPSHKHSYTSTVFKPTCTEKGFTTYECSCGYSYTANEVAASGHKYNSEVIAPSTSAQGYTQHTCSVCGDSYKNNYTDKLPEPTQPSAPEATEPEESKPTVDPGWDPIEIPGHTHTWGEWAEFGGEVVGRYRICSGCGDMDIDVDY